MQLQMRKQSGVGAMMQSRETGTDPLTFDKEFRHSGIKNTYIGGEYFDMINSAGDV